MNLSLEKKVAEKAPQLLSLAKSAKNALASSNLAAHRAKVCLALDVSGSMSEMVEAGTVQRVCDRALALGLNFDDDGDIDVFLFGRSVKQMDSLSVDNIAGFVQRFWGGSDHKQADWTGTNYGPVIKAVTENYFIPQKKSSGFLGLGGMKSLPVPKPMPAYVIFITDGENADRAEAQAAIIDASYGPVFWQFIGIGKENFAFLRALDDMAGRYTDNANFFKVENIDSMDDESLFRKMMAEYPGWIQKAKDGKLLT